MAIYKYRIHFLIAAVLLVLFWACEKPVDPPLTMSDFSGYSLLVKDTALSGTPACQLTVQQSNGWSRASGEPLIFNLFKYYPDADIWNLVGRIFMGGGNFKVGDTLVYWADNGTADTLICSDTPKTVIEIGSENQNTFYFGIAPLTGFQPAGGNGYRGGLEGLRIHESVLRATRLRTSLFINGTDPYTLTNIATVRATFNLKGIDSVDYVRYSALVPLPPSQILALDSIVRHANPSGTGYVALDTLNRIRLSDSVVVNGYSIPIGKFGGKKRVAADSAGLHSLFDIVTRKTANRTDGDTLWVEVTRSHDTLVAGAGAKWVFLSNPKWNTPLADSIEIQPYNIDIGLDAGADAIVNALENKTCLLSDNVPFSLNTFGDTTFDPTVYVWLATRNLCDRVIDMDGANVNANLALPLALQETHNAFGVTFPWPDALLETPPQTFALSSGGRISGNIVIDTMNYRVSPLCDAVVGRAADGSIAGTSLYAGDALARAHNQYSGLMITKGSVLGYQEKNLGRFSRQDSVVSDESGKLVKKPFLGWFEYEPLDHISPDGTFSGSALLDYFGSQYGVADINDLWSPVKGSGRNYYSIYSSFCYTPSIKPNSSKENGMDGIKLYRNPFRSLPYFVTSNMSGSKEFILCVWGKGKYFNEPRVSLSCFTSPKKYVWDKIPPHFAWDPSITPTDQRYAPLYYWQGSLKTISDLSLTATPYVFDVWLSGSPSIKKECSIRDVGFAKITSARLCFNYSADLQSIDPVTGYRSYQLPPIQFEIDSRALLSQTYGPYDYDTRGVPHTQSSGIVGTRFQGIDAQLWQPGLWDMWIETEDNLGNKGVAPYMSSGYSMSAGKSSVRQILIR